MRVVNEVRSKIGSVMELCEQMQCIPFPPQMSLYNSESGACVDPICVLADENVAQKGNPVTKATLKSLSGESCLTEFMD